MGEAAETDRVAYLTDAVRVLTDGAIKSVEALMQAATEHEERLRAIEARQMRFFDVDIARGQKLFGVAGRSAEDVETRVRAKLHPDQCACAEITITEVA